MIEKHDHLRVVSDGENRVGDFIGDVVNGHAPADNISENRNNQHNGSCGDAGIQQHIGHGLYVKGTVDQAGKDCGHHSHGTGFGRGKDTAHDTADDDNWNQQSGNGFYKSDAAGLRD